ncbi:hypothetical protein GCM10007962_17930 [Yeosuana aromativorans]|uniref:Uncharacterized protein n=1 Tax=Yeosuana aromativorans TaxID=288019 RepID=A0A8J3BNG1_9FLAO|nr:hypothetical protein [Yeosuana aromativorans]GGK24142.1 hypothetical protein GCM10007962_17930 [Yeosuana aromativorans]
MKKLTLIALLFITVLNYNCSSDDSIHIDKNDYLIFGHFYGMCAGDGCVLTYKLTDDTLYEDINHNYLGTDLNFKALDNNTFEQVKDLANYVPSELLNETESVFGCPDCADQGGLFIEISKNGVVKSCRIDQYKNNVPAYLYTFMDQVNEKIQLINN